MRINSLVGRRGLRRRGGLGQPALPSVLYPKVYAIGTMPVPCDEHNGEAPWRKPESTDLDESAAPQVSERKA